MIKKIKLVEIIKDSDFQARKTPTKEELKSLSVSMTESGYQPVKLRVIEGGYQIVYGHRRIAAARLLKWVDINAEVVVATDEAAAKMTLRENADRSNLSPLETAIEMDMSVKLFDMDETARMFSCSKETVLAYLRILDLPESIREFIHDGTIAKTAVPGLLAYFRIFGEDETLSIIRGSIKSEGDIGSHKLVNDMQNRLIWKSGAQFDALISNYDHRPRYDFPYDIAFPLKETLKPKPAKLMAFAKITNREAYDKLQVMIAAGIDVLAQPFLAEELTQHQVEIATIFTAPPACDACPFRVTMLETVYCSMKPCLKRKKDSWLHQNFMAYTKLSDIQVFSKKADANGVIIDETHTRSDDESKEKYTLMIKGKKTSQLRIRERMCQYGVWNGTNSKYAQLVDVSPKAIAVETKRVAEREKNSYNYNSPEQIAQRRVGEANRLAFYQFFDALVADLFISKMSVTLLELKALASIDDEDIQKIWGDIKITKTNRLALYRRCWVMSRAQSWGGWQAGDKGCRAAINDNLKPILEEFGIKLPEGFDVKADEFIKEALTEKDEEEINDEEDLKPIAEEDVNE